MNLGRAGRLSRRATRGAREHREARRGERPDAPEQRRSHSGADCRASRACLRQAEIRGKGPQSLRQVKTTGSGRFVAHLYCPDALDRVKPVDTNKEWACDGCRQNTEVGRSHLEPGLFTTALVLSTRADRAGRGRRHLHAKTSRRSFSAAAKAATALMASHRCRCRRTKKCGHGRARSSSARASVRVPASCRRGMSKRTSASRTSRTIRR